MSDNPFAKVADRLRHPERFTEALLKDICQQCVQVLKENSYGEKLPDEWTFDVNISGAAATASIFHTRLENDRETWEVIFAAHNSGSRRYMIYPVQALALSWVQDGVRYFSQGHEVGGIKPKWFAEKVEKLLADFERTLTKKWERWCATGHI